MYGENDIDHPVEVDPKYRTGPDPQSEKRDSFDEASSPPEEFEQVYGGVMPVDSTPRHVIDVAAENYSSVKLEYGEGVVHVTGDEEQVDQFVQDVIGAEKGYADGYGSRSEFFDSGVEEAIGLFFPSDSIDPQHDAEINT